MLTGKKSTLEPFGEEAIPSFLKWFNDLEITQYLNRVLPMYEHGEREWLQNLHKHVETDVVFGIKTTEKKFIGTIGLHRINHIHQNAVLGIIIGEKEEWNKGYGGDAIMTLLEYGFSRLNLHKVKLSVFAFNKRGITCYKHCGFKEEGRLKDERVHDWGRADEILMAVFRDDFRKLCEEWRKS